MSKKDFEILWPENLVGVDISESQAVIETTSSHPVDYIIDNPVSASLTLLAVVGVGLAFRSFNDRNSVDIAAYKAQEKIHPEDRAFLNGEDVV